jgi:hypothetical protein
MSQQTDEEWIQEQITFLCEHRIGWRDPVFTSLLLAAIQRGAEKRVQQLEADLEQAANDWERYSHDDAYWAASPDWLKRVRERERKECH